MVRPRIGHSERSKPALLGQHLYLTLQHAGKKKKLSSGRFAGCGAIPIATARAASTLSPQKPTRPRWPANSSPARPSAGVDRFIHFLLKPILQGDDLKCGGKNEFYIVAPGERA